MDQDGRFLITKRHPDKKFGNMWEFSSGGTLASETTTVSAIRELYEETDIKVNEDELKLLATYVHNNQFMDIYFVKKDLSLSDIRLNPEEAVDVKWATWTIVIQLHLN